MTMIDARATAAATPGLDWSLAGEDSEASPLAVTALLVVQHARTSWLDRTLQALAALDEGPERLVLVDATPERSVRDLLDQRSDLADTFADVSVVTVPAHSAFAAIVDTAVEALPRPGEDAVVARRVRRRARKRDVRPRDKYEWLWLLHEDSAPAPGALAALLRVVSRSERIGIAGCKVVELSDPERLVNVGLDVTRTGRHVGGAMQGEPDQGQYDDRHDVLAVSSSGMLIRRDVYLSLGGFDPAFDGDGDGLDLCWRTHLLGHQVVVVPQARVSQDVGGTTVRSEPVDDVDARPSRTPRSLRRHGDSGLPAPQSARTLRRHRQVALARCSWLGLPVIALWTLLSCLVLGLVLLAVKRPRYALAELSQASAPFGLRRVLGARARFVGRARTRPTHLGALFVPLGAATHHAWDAVRDAVTPAPREPELLEDSARLEAGPEGDEAAELVQVRTTWGRRTARHAGLWMTIALVASTAVWWRGLLTSDALRGTAQGLQGGELRSFDTDASGVRHLWSDHWVGAGLGSDLPEQPFLPVLSVLARAVQALPWVDDTTTAATAVAWLLVLAVPLSGVSAYVAGRAVTRAQWPRAVAGLAWAGLATLSTGVASGRLGPVVAHVLLPLALAGAFAVGRRTAAVPLTFATVLVTALLGAFAPVLLVAVSFVALGVLLVGTGWARLRAAVVLLGPWALLGPWTFDRLRADSRGLLAGPGALDTAAPAQPWQLALLHPGGPGSYLAVLSVPVVVLGVLGLIRRRPQHGRTTVGLGLLALLGLAAALAASHVIVTDAPGGARTPWPGPALDVTAAALIGAALLAGGDLFARPRWKAASRRVRVALVAGLVVALAWAGVVLTTVVSQGQPALTAADERVPAVARQMGLGERANRMLTISVDSDGSVSYALDGAETGLPARDLDVPVRTSPQLARGVASLLGPSTAGGGQAHRQLLDLDVGFVGVTGAGDRAALARSLQSVQGLSAMASNRSLSLWRVDAAVGAGGGSVPPSRLRLDLDGRPVLALPSSGPHARTVTRVPAGADGRRLVVSESGGWARRAVVTLDGRWLHPVAASAYPTYDVPASGGLLRVDPGAAHDRWRWVQGALLLVTIFLAVPFGNARSRRRA
ncbi:glycosyltransferase [Luteipulveratus halotolerans]|uniref:Glycosyltransferase 2-like domain-containing protein n=1 Tax=Luteipulveratus halotolerans TaxID=1631356 RepID=A0A0L6CJP5_9MICO|nr:glycosyltransferase [Luteipulveratus halotolerans]KNX37743.1 hypothetical protein VV01_12245 [Luteipulveratus halotolerans]